MSHLPPEGLTSARYLVRRLRAQFADLPIVVGRWGGTAAALGRRAAGGDRGLARRLHPGRRADRILDAGVSEQKAKAVRLRPCSPEGSAGSELPRLRGLQPGPAEVPCCHPSSVSRGCSSGPAHEVAEALLGHMGARSAQAMIPGVARRHRPPGGGASHAEQTRRDLLQRDRPVPRRSTPLLMKSDTGRLPRSGLSATAKATSRSVRMPIGRPASTTGTAPQSASRKIMLASRTELKAEQVRGLAVITSAAVRGGRVGSAIGEGSTRRRFRSLILCKRIMQVSDRDRVSGMGFAPDCRRRRDHDVTARLTLQESEEPPWSKPPRSTVPGSPPSS